MKKKGIVKRILTGLITVAMIMTALPVGAGASEASADAEDVSIVQDVRTEADEPVESDGTVMTEEPAGTEETSANEEPAEEEFAGEIEEAEAQAYDRPVVEYDLWLGGTMVTSENCDDLSALVMGDGASASFDPLTNTLTLDKVTGIRNSVLNPYRGLIYAKVPLTIRGNASIETDFNGEIIYMNGADLTMEGKFTLNGGSDCLYVNGNLILQGSDSEFRFTSAESGGDYAVYVTDSIVMDAKYLYAKSFARVALFTVTGDMEFLSGITELHGGLSKALNCLGVVIFGENMQITSPENCAIYDNRGKMDSYIGDEDGIYVRDAVISCTSPSHTVRFDLNGIPGTAPDQQTVTEGKKASKPEDPQEPDGFRFNGWYTSPDCLNAEWYDFDTPVTGNLELYAGFLETENHTVTFDANGKAATGMPEAQQIADGRLATKPADPTAEGWKFAGWYLDKTCKNSYHFSTKVRSDLLLYAKWMKATVSTVTVSFVLGGHGAAIPAQIVEKGKKAVKPDDPADARKIFSGWFTDQTYQNAFDFGKAVQEDTVAYAKWETLGPQDFVAYFDMAAGGLTYDTGLGRYEHVYTGSPITPKVVVKSVNNAHILSEGVDYTIKYTNNVNVDKNGKSATVVITCKGNYAGKKTLSFFVMPKSIGNGKASAAGVTLYPLIAENGKSADPILYYNNLRLTAKDYTLYSSTGNLKFKDTDVSPKLSIVGKGNYAGSIRNVDVQVITKAQKTEKTIKVSLSDVSNIVYNGAPQLLSVEQLIVTDGNGQDLPAAAYHTDYENNVNAGTAKVTVTGLGDYTGTITKTFKIAPDKKNAVMSVAPNRLSISYAPGGARPGVTVKAKCDGNERILTEGVDYKLTYAGNDKVNPKAKANVTFMGNYAGQKPVSCTFNIAPLSMNVISGTDAYAPDLLYTGPGKYLSEPYVTYGGVPLKKNRDYTVTYWVGDREITKENRFVPAGNETNVDVMITGKGNYFNHRVFKNCYQIKKNTNNIIDLSKAKITMKGNMKKPIPAQVYTGADIKPEFDIYVRVNNEWKTAGEAGLTEGIDYNVKYVNNRLKGTATIQVIAHRGGWYSSKAVKGKTATFKIGILSISEMIRLAVL
ncbi:MAG: InlB B-repeat-containing protein [Lachnospiraceae bacterium]|nr:InlB B-repeat-containing protein [Lachnospiraceae bacterium]